MTDTNTIEERMLRCAKQEDIVTCEVIQLGVDEITRLKAVLYQCYGCLDADSPDYHERAAVRAAQEVLGH